MKGDSAGAIGASLKDAQTHFKAGRLAEARSICLSLIETPDTRGDGYYGLGLIAAKEGNTSEARAYFEKCLEAAPKAVDAHIQLGNLLEPDDIDGARDHFEAALAFRPGHQDATDALARIAARETGAPPTAQSVNADLAAAQQTASPTAGLLRAILAGAVAGAAAFAVLTILPRDFLGLNLPTFGSNDVIILAGAVAALAFVIAAFRALRGERTEPDPFIDLVRRDTDPMSEELAQLLSRVTLARRPSWIAYLDRILIWPAVLGGILAVGLPLLREIIGDPIPRIGAEEAMLFGAGVAVLLAVLMLLRILSMHISVRQGRVRIARGILFRNVTHIELPRITDVTVRRGPLGLLTGHGAIVLSVGSDTTRREELRGIRRGSALYSFAEDLRQATIALRASRWGRDVLVWR